MFQIPKKQRLMRVIKDIIGAFEGVTVDWFARGIVNWLGYGHDPNGCQLPRFPSDKQATAQVPKEGKQNQGNAKVIVGYGESGMLYDTPSQSNAGEVEEAITDMHGITEREYGEMLDYRPPLRDLKLASKIKARKADGFSLDEISKQLKIPLQTVKHYSSALNKASPSYQKKGGGNKRVRKF